MVSPPASDKAEAPKGWSDAPAPIPKIDVHMHIALEVADHALALMEQNGIAIGLNASGGMPGGGGLEESVALAKRSGGRIEPYCNLRLSLTNDPEFARYVAQTLSACKAMGGRGVKLAKSLGLGVTDPHGKLRPVDDPVFDPIFEHAAELGLPVLIHSGDPKAFFEAPTPDNERFEELSAHPAWSFYGTTPNGEVWPTWASILDAFERRVARHPKTIFVGAHFGNAPEEPQRVESMLERFPNYFIDTAARVPEIGRHPAARMRRLFVRHQDRILFGSDLAVLPQGLILGSGGSEPDRADDAPRFFLAQALYFETRGRQLPSPTPIQGRWTLEGLGLPRAVLEKLYFRNAAQVFGLSLPPAPTSPKGPEIRTQP